MNIPNRLTIARVALIPVCLFFLYVETPFCQAMALVAFLVAAATDWLDGYLARRNNTVTNFGKFLDPVADKLLVLSVMIALVGQQRFPAWACIVILFRELAVDGLRMVAVEQRKVIAAGKLGKIKTTLQMVTLVAYLLSSWSFGSLVLNEVLMFASVVMTIWSGVDYFVRNWDVLRSPGGKAGV